MRSLQDYTNEQIRYKNFSEEVRLIKETKAGTSYSKYSCTNKNGVTFYEVSGMQGLKGSAVMGYVNGDRARPVIIGPATKSTIVKSSFVMRGATVVVTGGVITTIGLYTIHKFTSDGVFDISPSGRNLSVDVLVVGGGGGWNYGSDNLYFGGGGAGGLIHYTGYAASGNNPVVIGAAGNSYPGTYLPATNGGGSSVFSIAVSGGGKGGDGPGSAGSSGGSGGGGGSGYSAPGGVGGAGTPGQGYNGSDGGGYRQGGSGGGAGGAGGAQYGGNGVVNSISGSSVTYATGGNGSIANVHNYPLFGEYGSGAGMFPYNQPYQSQGAWPGVVIIRYLTSDLVGS